MRRAAVLFIFLLLLPAAFADKKGEGQSSDLIFEVVKADNGKPIRSASIILHPVDGRGRQGTGGFQLKTNGDGRATVNSVPYGKLRVQVIAPGYQTFGQDFEIGQAAQTFVVKLNRPQPQHSIYK